MEPVTGMRAIRRRLLGIAFVFVLAGLIGLSIAAYQKVFTATAGVLLETDFTGNQLDKNADVKVRGVEVGTIKAIHSTGKGAKIELQLDPARLSEIPNNVTAQLLPKTLFGQRFVALQIPPDPGPAIKAGDIIEQDHSIQGTQVQDLLRNIQPVLNALNPAELNATLTALATALKGRGDQIGKNLADLDDYLKQINPSMPQAAEDIVNFGKVAALYDSALPDVIATLDNIKSTSTTISASNGAAFKRFLTEGTSTSNALRDFFKADGSRLISVSSVSAQIFAVLAQYAPEYVCVLQAASTLDTRVTGAFSADPGWGATLHVSVTNSAGNGLYAPSEKPKMATPGAPSCAGLPNGSVAASGRILDDGAAQIGGTGSGALRQIGAFPNNPTLYSPTSFGESQMVSALIAGDYGYTPAKVPAITSLLAAPTLRGSSVDVTVK